MLGFKLLWRDWRGGELGLLLAALLVAVSIVVSIALFVERIQGAILAESSQFLAADRLVRSDRPIPDLWSELASDNDLSATRVLHFPTMAFAGEEMVLSAVKAVGDEYPLLGELELRGRAEAETEAELEFSNRGPAPGKAWVAPRLLNSLGVKLGDSLFVGEAELQIEALLMREPDAGFSVFSYGPRVLMNVADIPRSEVVQPGSRVQYNFLVSGDQSSLESWQEAMEDVLAPEQSILGVRDSQPQLAKSINRAERFLLLAGSMGVLLAGVAIAIASRRYTERHYDYVGILRSLGSSARTVLSLYLGHLAILCGFGVLLGCLIGWLLHLFALQSLSGLLLVDLPEAGWRPYALGALTAFISFVAFACPSLLHLQKVAPMRVLRRDLGTPDFNSRSVFLLGLAGFVALILLYSKSLWITAALIIGVAVIAAVVLYLTWAVLKGSRNPGLNTSNPFGLAIAGIRRRARHSALQVFVFTVVLLLVLTLLLARNALLQEWRMQMPEGTPNHFLININPADVEPLDELLQSRGYEHAGLYPMVRARFDAHNNEVPVRKQRPGDESQPQDGPADGVVARTLNLSWAEDLPEDNELLEGAWWSEAQAGELSLEREFADRYSIKLNDTLGFSMDGQNVELKVTSIRSLDWEQMRPNFYAIASPGSLAGFDEIYMTSFHLPDGDKAFLNDLIRVVPTLSIIEMDRMIEQVTRIIDQVSTAVELVLALIIISAAIVLFASVQTSMDERSRENAILKTLGARLSLLKLTTRYEFLLLGVLAGLLASLGAELVIGLVQVKLMELSYQPHWWVLLVGPVLGGVVVMLLGVWISRPSLASPPATVLREL